MKKKLLFIINPISGVGKQKTIEKLIEKHLDHQLFDYEIKYTQAAKHAIEISKEAANNYDIVVAVGGDGSVNEVSKGLINSNTALAIIPTGSGNGLARHLNIPRRLEESVKLLNNYVIKEIDTININEEKFVNVAGIGFDARIAHIFNKFKKRGFRSYVKIIQNQFIKHNESVLKAEITIDGNTSSEEGFIISFANSSQYGNNAHIAPKASINDGLIDICLIKNFPIEITPILALRLFTKSIHQSKYTKVLQGKEITIKLQNHRKNKRIEAHIDGEPVYFSGDININVNPKSLKVIVPTRSFLSTLLNHASHLKN